MGRTINLTLHRIVIRYHQLATSIQALKSHMEYYPTYLENTKQCFKTPELIEQEIKKAKEEMVNITKNPQAL